MTYADVNGIKIFYEIHGEGQPLFLVHGFGASRLVWIAQIKPLSEHFKVITFDNRGAGKSDRPDEPYTMDTFADDLKGLMDHLEIEKAHVVGWLREGAQAGAGRGLPVLPGGSERGLSLKPPGVACQDPIRPAPAAPATTASAAG